RGVVAPHAASIAATAASAARRALCASSADGFDKTFSDFVFRIAPRRQLGEHTHAAPHPLVVDSVDRACRVGLVERDGLLLERERLLLEQDVVLLELVLRELRRSLRRV